MTIFSTPRLQREDMDVSEFGAGQGAAIGAAATEAFEESPTVQLFGMRELNEVQAKDQGTDLESAIGRVQAGADPADVMFGTPTRARPEMLPMEARERVKEAGLDKQLTIPDGAMIQPSALDIMMERARHRQERAATIARGPSGIIPTALSIGTSFLVGAVDPINAGAAFIPVVGELRYAKMLEAAGESALARAGVRAQVGAASGAVGMAAIEPIAAFAKTQEGQDYTMAMALRSVIFGAALGGVLHTGGGQIADILRTRGERPLYPFAAGEPLEFHTPFDELRQPPAGSNLPLPGDQYRAPVRLPETFEEAARRADHAGQPEPVPAEPTAARPGDTGAPPRAGEPPATTAEGGARAAPFGEAGPEAGAERGLSRGETTVTINGETRTLKTEWSPEEIAAAQRPSPVVAMIDDLPPRAREDAMRAATAALIDGRPVQSGDIIAAGARMDPRIAESVAEGNAHAIATAAELSPHGRIVFNDMRGQLKRAGMTDEEAAANAAIVAARYEARAARLEGAGGTAEDLYRAEGIRVQRGGFDDDAMGRTYGQPPTVPTFFSAVSKAIGSARQEKASPEQWLATLRNTPGVRGEELQWLGLPDWLKEQKGSVTRKDIQDYVRANNIEVREVIKGAGAPAHDPLTPAERREFDELVDATHGYSEELSDAQRDRLQQLHDRDNGFGQQQEQSGEPATSDAKFAQYTLPGGENYRELLLTLPRKPDREGAPVQGGDTLENFALRPGQPTVIRDQEFVSTHWDEPNVISHIRFNDRIIDGKKTLFIEEIQSDWHQAGKRKGYQTEDVKALDLQRSESAQAYDAAERRFYDAIEAMPDQQEGAYLRNVGYRLLTEAGFEPKVQMPPSVAAAWDAAVRAHSAFTAASDRARAAQSGVPDAPFKTTWPELAFKRMIRYAAENGYEKIAWTPGEVQAERYDLSKHVRDIEYVKNADGTFKLAIVDHSGNDVQIPNREHMTLADIENMVGKDIAQKISDGEGRRYRGHDGNTLEGLDLKVGGEGMAGFYDKILPATVNKLVKKYGAKVEDVAIEKPGGIGQWKYEGPDLSAPEIIERSRNASAAVKQQMLDIARDVDWKGMSLAEAVEKNGSYAAAEHLGGKLEPLPQQQSVHAIDLTEPLRKAATEEGFPLFQREPGGEMRGRITLADNKAIIDLFSQSDRSTFMHETGHLWLDELARDAARANAPEGIRKDMETVLKWLGADRADAITTEQHEKWASAFEQYLATGKAPTEGLSGIFQQFKDWLTAIYKGIVGSGEPISDDIRAVMDRMIATPAQIEREAADRAATVHMGPRPARGPGARDPGTFHLFEFLADRGGLRPDPELVAMFGGANPFIPGFGKLIRKGGMGLDRAREAAVEAGYLHDAPAREAEALGGTQARPSESTERDLLDAMDRRARGEKVYREGREPQREHAFDPDEEMHRVESELNHAIADAGMQPHEISGTLRARTIEIMHREGERDPLNAYERAVMEESYYGAENGKNERIPDHIPGWDQVSHDAGAAPAPSGPVETIRGPAGPGAGQGPRGPGAGNRRAAGQGGEGTADTWRRLADTPRDFNEPDVIAASKRADALPEPASLQPGKRLAAAQKADADSALTYDAQAEFLPADLKGKVEQELRLLDQEGLDTAEVVRRGAACLASGVVGAAV